MKPSEISLCTVRVYSMPDAFELDSILRAAREDEAVLYVPGKGLEYVPRPSFGSGDENQG